MHRRTHALLTMMRPDGGGVERKHALASPGTEGPRPWQMLACEKVKRQEKLPLRRAGPCPTPAVRALSDLELADGPHLDAAHAGRRDLRSQLEGLVQVRGLD